MNNNIQCSIESSTTKIELNSAVEGVFLVPELEGLAGLPEIRTTSGVNAGYDGGWTSAQNYDARLISIRGVIANPDVSKVEVKRRAIASLLGQGRKEQLTLRFTTEAGNAYTISVRTISCEMALQRVLTTQEFLIQLRADDPLIYDDGASSGTEAVLQVQRALGGFEINFELPLAIGGGAEDTIVENGSETVYPIINLCGPLHSPTVVNRTTNQQMQILADLQYTISWSGYQTEDIGSYDQLENELDGAPMYLSQLTGNAEQTTYSGKNLLAYPYKDADGTISGITWTTSADGYVKGTGTTTAGTNFYFRNNPDYWVAPDSATYTISLDGTHNGMTLNIRDDTTSTTVAQIAQSETSKSFSAVASHNYRVYFNQSNTNTAVNIGCYIQLEKGSTATAHEPYVGGTASPNPDYPQLISTVTGAQTVTVTGKNLFGGLTEILTAHCSCSLVNNIMTITPTDTTYNTAVTFALGAEIPSGATVHLSSSTTIAASTQLRDSSSVIVANFGGGIDTTKTLSGTADRITFNWLSTGSTTPFAVDLSTLQIEIGSTATDYEPYQSQTKTIDLDTIELAKIGAYQDRIYKDDGKWYVEKQVGKVVLDGSESYAYSSGNNWAYFYFATIGAGACDSNSIGISNNFTRTTINSMASDTTLNGVFAISADKTYFAIRNTTLTSKAEYDTWLASNPTTVYYALATATTTEITDETLLAQLNFIASLYEGVNNISLVPAGGAQGEIVVKYATVKTINQDVAVIDSQARTITLNGQDIYHLKSEESEFLLLAPGDNKLYLTSEVSDDSGYAEVKFKQGYLSI